MEGKGLDFEDDLVKLYADARTSDGQKNLKSLTLALRKSCSRQ